jgi:LacI family transcriptional regulator
MTAVLRRKGFEAALREKSVDLPAGFIGGGSDSEEVVEAATRALLAKRRPPDAIFCYNDPVAIAAMRTILASGLRVPEDIALVGVGNVRYVDLLPVPLTTVDQRPREMGERAAGLLLSQLDGTRRLEKKEVILPARLVVRESSGVRRIEAIA